MLHQQEEAEQYGVLVEEPAGFLDHGRELVAAVAARSLQRIEAAGEGRVFPREEIEDQRVLAGIVPIKRALGDPRALRDVADRRLADPFRHEEPQRRLLDPLPRCRSVTHLPYISE